MSNLFNFANYSRITPPLEPRVQTPFGPLVLEVSVHRERQSDVIPEVFSDTSWPNQGFVFPFAAARAELLICPLKPCLPPGRSVEQCWGCVLRVWAKIDHVNLTFCCRWADEVSQLDGGGNSGEYLEAQTWDDGVTEISLGTSDEEGLFCRAGRELPSSWSQSPHAADMSGLYVHGIDNRGLRIAPPPLMKDESCELYFKVAWCKYSEENANSWFAVDPMGRSNSPWWPGQENFLSST